jgi:hypothetical protein
VIGLSFFSGIAYQNAKIADKYTKLSDEMHDENNEFVNIALGQTMLLNMKTLDLIQKNDISKLEKIHRNMFDYNFLQLQDYKPNAKMADIPRPDVSEMIAKAIAFKGGKKTIDSMPQIELPPIEKTLVSLLEKRNVRLRDVQKHLQEYKYQHWIDFDDFVSFITFEGNVFGPRIILFFYESKLYAVIHTEKFETKTLKFRGSLGNHQIGYVSGFPKELKQRFDAFYEPILKNAD